MSFSCERIRREFDFRPWRESAVSGFGALARPWKEKDGRKTRSGARSKKQARHGTPSQHDDCQTGHVIIQRSRLPRVVPYLAAEFGVLPLGYCTQKLKLLLGPQRLL